MVAVMGLGAPGVASGQEAPRPTAPYVVQNACPFECCAYGEWEALESFTAYERLRDTTSASLVVDEGTRFQALTGIEFVDTLGVVVVTRRVETGYKHGPFLPGDTVLVLNHWSEGYYDLWHRDEIIADSRFWASPSEYEAAEGRYGGMLVTPSYSEWWVQIRALDGRVWWSNMWSVRVRGDTRC